MTSPKGRTSRAAHGREATTIGRIPVGNTGPAEVPLRATGPLPADLAELTNTR